MNYHHSIKQNVTNTRFPSLLRLRVISILLACCCLLNVTVSGQPLPKKGHIDQKEETAKKKPAAKKTDQPLVQFLKLKSPVDDVILGNVTNVALELQNQSALQDREAILVLEITAGTSQFHHIRSLAKFLTSTKLSRVRTIAWVPETVDGNNVILAFSCKEIVMHPDAGLGDIGRGERLDDVDQRFIRDIADKRHNPKVNAALVSGLFDVQAEVLKVKIQSKQQAGETESRVVSPRELKKLRDNRVAIVDVETIKEAGEIGIISGSKARGFDVLVSQTAESLVELANLYKIPLSALREKVNSTQSPIVKLIKIDGMIEPILEQFIERQIDRAVNVGANIIVFEVDSPGGYFVTSQNLVDRIRQLETSDVKSVAYVPHEAISGAALISLACDEIYLSPKAKIGDIGMIVNQGNGAFREVPEKQLSPLRTSLRTLGEETGRPPSLLESMCDKELKVFEVSNLKSGQIWYMSESEIHASNGEWKKGGLVHETREGNFLTLNGKRAHELKLTEAPVRDMTELKIRLGMPAGDPLLAVERTWVDTMIFILNTPLVTGLLFFAGIVLIYIEMHFTSGLFGTGAAICFALFFWSKFLGGTAGWLEVILFMLGLVLIGLELFMIPGFGVTGVTGGLLVMASLLMASQTFGNLEPYADMKNLSRSMGTLGGSFIAVIFFAVLLNKFLPNIPFLNSIILLPPGEQAMAEGPRLHPDLLDLNATGVNADALQLTSVGDVGVTCSILRPSGKVRLGGNLLDVVSNGPYIQQDREVEVIKVNGNRITVREIITKQEVI